MLSSCAQSYVPPHDCYLAVFIVEYIQQLVQSSDCNQKILSIATMGACAIVKLEVKGLWSVTMSGLQMHGTSVKPLYIGGTQLEHMRPGERKEGLYDILRAYNEARRKNRLIVALLVDVCHRCIS